jgi:phospholipase A-2-activating protein
LDQVADFIIKNADGVNLGSSYQDPFTGGNRYTPQQSSQPASSASYMDPFTGGGSYRPGASTTGASAPTTYSDPFTGGGSYRPAGSAPVTSPQQQQPKLLPIVSAACFFGCHRNLHILV